MKTWLVKLRGDAATLWALYDLMKSSNPSVVNEVDDYYLHAAEWDTLADPLAVSDAARDILPTINGAVAVQLGSFNAVEIESIVGIDEHGQRLTSPAGMMIAAAGAMGMARAVLLDLNGSPIPQPPSTAQIELQLAYQDTFVRRALRFFSPPHNWIKLYKVFEIIRDDIGAGRLS